jgi:hypothetical protein
MSAPANPFTTLDLALLSGGAGMLLGVGVIVRRASRGAG